MRTLAASLVVACVVGVALLAAQHGGDAPVELSSCTPCFGTPGCESGCLSQAAAARMAHRGRLAAATQRLAARRSGQSGMIGAAVPSAASLRGQEGAVGAANAQLLRLQGAGRGDARLGDIMQHAVGDVVKAEAAEVRMRREARGAGGGRTVADAYSKMGSAQKQLFHLRARELELALDQADKQITKAGRALLPFAEDASERKRAAKGASKGSGKAKENWTSAMSDALSSLVTDGSGRVWGVGSGATPKAQKKARMVMKKQLPGVVEDNWTLDKGALGMRPAGDDAKLPGVKTSGW